MADSIKSESINGTPEPQLAASLAIIRDAEVSSGDDDDDDDDDLDDEDQVNLDDDDEDSVSCLFCCCNAGDNKIAGDDDDAAAAIGKIKSFPNVQAAIDHLKDGHQFDLRQLKRKFNMDQYSYIKMINFIRTTAKSVNTAELILNANECPWTSDEYLKPIGDFDNWLVYDFENLDTLLPASTITTTTTTTTSECSLTMEQFLLNKVEELNEELRKKSDELHQASMDMQLMRNSFNHLLEKLPNSSVVVANVNHLNSYSNNNNNNNKSNNSNNYNSVKKPIKNRPSKDSSKSPSSSYSASAAYFDSYNHYGIHYDMINDTVRTESYRNAILNNKNIIENKIVMDLGCGTSILSLFAAEAGAKIVYAIDDSEIVYDAMDIGRINNMNNKIRYVKGRIENQNPHNSRIKEKVDIIISEWMGYFLLYEGMLDSVIYARDNWLNPNGQLLPNRCTINLCAYGDEKRYAEYIQFWDNVHGYDMTTIKEKVYGEAQLEVCDPKCILSVDSVCLADYDIQTVTTAAPNFTKSFTFTIGQDGKLTGFVGWFDTHFNLPNRIEFSTSPNHLATHWKQVVFYLDAPVPVKMGDQITGVFKCERDPKYVRGINMQITVFNKNHKYYLE